MQSNYHEIYNNVKCNDLFLSICIPTYLRQKYLIEALDSIFNQKNSNINYEILLCSNNIKEDFSWLDKKLYDLPIRLIVNNINLGMKGNINQCAKLSNGKYIAYLHDDDLLSKNYLSMLEKCFKANTEIDAIIFSRKIIGDKKNFFKKIKRRFLFALSRTIGIFKKKNKLISRDDLIFSIRNVYYAPTCGTIFKKEILEKNNYFEGSHNYAFDLEAFERLNFKNAKIYSSRYFGGYYRMTESATNKPTVALDLFSAYYDLLKLRNYGKKANEFLNKYYNEILTIVLNSYNIETRDLIKNKYPELKNLHYNKMKIIFLNFIRQVYLLFNDHCIEI